MSKQVAVEVGARVQVRTGQNDAIELHGKAALLVALVALEGQADRRRVARLLWPESSEGQARNNLRTLLHRLHQRAGADFMSGAERLCLDEATAKLRIGSCETMLADGSASEAHGSELLAQAGVEAEASEPLQQWLEAARSRHRRQRLAALADALNLALEQADAQRAIALARACVQVEPLSEHWHRQLMDTLARCGDRGAALAAYEDCKERLRQQLGVLPDMQTRTVQLRILQSQASVPLRRDVMPLPAQPSMATGLTPLGGAARYPLVEREAVLAELQAALAQGQHVALQGEAGVGKTRLLRHVAGAAGFEQVVIQPGARSEPFAALAQLLHEMQPRQTPRIGLPEQVELARLAPMAFPDVQPSQASLGTPRLHAALRHWAAQLREAGVQRLVLDDLHYADAASQAAIAALLSDTGENRAPLLLLAHRTGEIEPVLAEALVGAQVLGQLKSITLPRLTLQGVQTLLQAMHADEAGARAGQLLQRTGGNPLFVIELARHAMEEAELADSAGRNIGALLRARLAACSAAAQQLAAVAAVAEQDFSVELAETMTGQPALAMMPAWSELQQRGLFADHGLAHDLVRDAALEALPPTIGRKLHRQVAGYLQDQGVKGAKVLAHWRAAQDFDQALPHLAHQLYAASAAGLPTVQLEKELLVLMAQLSDTALLEHLWLTVEVDAVHREDEVLRTEWPRLAALVERVRQLVRPETADHWLALEAARLLHLAQHQPGQAYAGLCEAARRMPQQGVVRAWVELHLAYLALQLAGTAAEHAVRARAALAGVPQQQVPRRLLKMVVWYHAFNAGMSGLFRAKLAEQRIARRTHDLGAVEAIRSELAAQCMSRGCTGSAYRYYGIATRVALSDARLLEGGADLYYWSVAALRAGRYTQALRLLGLASQVNKGAVLVIVRACLLATLGQWSQARAVLDDLDLQSLVGAPLELRSYAAIRRLINLQADVDPMPILRQVHAMALEAGVGGVNRRMLDWELALVTQGARERVAFGTQLLADMLSAQIDIRRRTRLQLDLAEAHQQAGSAGQRSLALEAARELRRGRILPGAYLPDALVRCANLLQPTDPRESAALLHVAVRWVRQALPHVPDYARESFLNEVPANRLLLAV